MKSVAVFLFSSRRQDADLHRLLLDRQNLVDDDCMRVHATTVVFRARGVRDHDDGIVRIHQLNVRPIVALDELVDLVCFVWDVLDVIVDVSQHDFRDR